MNESEVSRAPMVYRVEVEVRGERHVWAVIAPDFVEAARRATQLTPGPDDRVIAIRPIGELLE